MKRQVNMNRSNVILSQSVFICIRNTRHECIFDLNKTSRNQLVYPLSARALPKTITDAQILFLQNICKYKKKIIYRLWSHRHIELRS